MYTTLCNVLFELEHLLLNWFELSCQIHPTENNSLYLIHLFIFMSEYFWFISIILNKFAVTFIQIMFGTVRGSQGSWCKLKKSPQTNTTKSQICLHFLSHFFVVSKCNMVYHLMASTWWTTSLLVFWIAITCSIKGATMQWGFCHYIQGLFVVFPLHVYTFIHIQSLTSVQNTTRFFLWI